VNSSPYTYIMKAGWFTVAFFFFFLASAGAFGQCSNDLVGAWHNETKATITITMVAPNGVITGTYNARPVAAEATLPLTGWVDAAAPVPNEAHVMPVILTVQLAPYGSIIVWSGYLSKGKDGISTITTIWSVVTAAPDPDNSPDHNAVNAAVFKPGVAE
jgi:hypothetical protein